MPSGGGGGGQTITLPVSIANGGTGQTTAAAALAALGGVGPGKVGYTKGNGGGDITISSTTFVDIQSGLNQTLTVPIGSTAFAVFVCNGFVVTNGHNCVVGIAIDGTVGPQAFVGGNLSVAGDSVPMTAIGVLVGDGNSHTFKPQALTQTGGSCVITNSVLGALLQIPSFLVVIIPAS